MKILIVAPTVDQIGGVASVVHNLSRYLQSRGHETIFLYSGKSTFAKRVTTNRGDVGFELNLQEPFGTRHPLISLVLFVIRFPMTFYQLIRIIQKNKIQIINVHYPSDSAYYFALCRRLLSVALVTSVHGADLFPEGKVRKKYSRAIKLLLNSSDRIVSPSHAYQRDVVALFPFLRDKMVSIHNGVNRVELDQDSKDTATAIPGSYVLCIAMHNAKKGLDVLLHAFALMRDAAPSLKLVLAGDGPLRGQLEKLASSLGIADRVEFLGLTGRDRIVRLLHGCEVFVLPSRSEPFGIVVIEAMACGKPVVASNVGGIPEIIENGRDGILVEPDNPSALAEALVTVLNDRDLRVSMANNGYMTARTRFCIENTGSSYESMFTYFTGSRNKDTLELISQEHMSTPAVSGRENDSIRP